MEHADGALPVAAPGSDGFVRVRGAREHNLKNVDLEIPRDALVVFTGVSGSGKSSLAFGTLYAEAQRRYLESVSPYARRLFHQLGVPEVDEIDGLPPAVALQQQRGLADDALVGRQRHDAVEPAADALLARRRLPAGPAAPLRRVVLAEHARGGVPECHGLGRVYDGDRAVDGAGRLADHPRAGRRRLADRRGTARTCATSSSRSATTSTARGASCRRRTATGSSSPTSSRPCRSTPGYTPDEVRRALKRKEEPSYMGTFTSARRYVLHTFANTQSPLMKKRVVAVHGRAATARSADGKRLRRESLSVTFAGLDIADISRLPLARLADDLAALCATGRPPGWRSWRRSTRRRRSSPGGSPRTSSARLAVLLDLGLGYLSLERSTPTLSPGELQRLRLATQVRSNLFGVVYVLDEPSAGLHPADTEALLRALDRLKASGNSLFVVEHELDVIRHADWIVDVGPAAGEQGGAILYSGPPDGLRAGRGVADPALPVRRRARRRPRRRATPKGWLRLAGVTRNNLHGLDVAFPLGVFTTVTGVSGSGKSSLVSQALVELVAEHLGHELAADEEEGDELERTAVGHRSAAGSPAGMEAHQAAGAGRPEADRPHAALEPRHLHRAVRPRPQAVRRDQGGAGPPLRRRAVLVQRRQGPLRDLRGRGLRDGRAAVPAERLRPVPGLPRRALQREDAGDQVPRQEHRRRARA